MAASPHKQDPVFSEAVKYVSAASHLKLNDQQKLRFYALFKQASVGKNTTAKPGFFDFVGKAKWEAWNSLGNMKKSEAQAQYVTEVTKIAPEWRTAAPPSPSKAAKKSGGGGGAGGPRVSTMKMETGDEEDDESDEEEWTPGNICEWAEEGDLAQVKKALSSGTKVDWKDSEGRTALHRAADRGHEEVVRALLKARADPNAQDSTGQTPLHYAVLCEYTEVITALLAAKADPNILDSDKQSPLSFANAEIRELIKKHSA